MDFFVALAGAMPWFVAALVYSVIARLLLLPWLRRHEARKR